MHRTAVLSGTAMTSLAPRCKIHHFGNMRAQCDAQKKSPFSPGSSLGGFGLLKNGGESRFDIMGQAGVFLAIYPKAAGWGVSSVDPASLTFLKKCSR